MKSAWLRLLKGDDPSHFYTTTAIYYDINKAGKIAYYNDTFALVNNSRAPPNVYAPMRNDG